MIVVEMDNALRELVIVTLDLVEKIAQLENAYMIVESLENAQMDFVFVKKDIQEIIAPKKNVL
jgi:hypothetical protein